MRKAEPCFECGRPARGRHYVVPKGLGGTRTASLCTHCLTRVRSRPCFECGQPSHHAHHVVPESLGGTRTVPLCLDCHTKVHGKKQVHSALIRAGLDRARARGVRLGAAPGARAGIRLKVTAEQAQEIRRLRSEGMKISRIARTVGLSRPTIYSVINDGE